PLGFKNEPLLVVQPLLLEHLLAAFAQQAVSLLYIEVLMIDAAIQVERQAADVHVAAAFAQQFLARNVVSQTVSGSRRRYDVEMVVDGMGLKRRPCRVGAGPDHE